jgi:hypothetical protein
MVSCALRQPAGHVENYPYVRAATLNRVSENRTERRVGARLLGRCRGLSVVPV